MEHTSVFLYQIEKQNKIKLPFQDPDNKAATVVTSRSHMSEETESFINKLKESYEEVKTVSAGSSLKLCLVAEGKADFYPRYAPTMEWDTGAGQAIVELAGGKVEIADESLPLTYNKENLRNPWFWQLDLKLMKWGGGAMPR
ncbi:3'(2'),5'-bisphosphate nucleotidase CysQ [Alteribacillus sp. HJP-4]|uniref:3'(2'),5'-bisphosphate nucleotidase CysQ family protein n=1 Tax=Alteribacillus sp. HJP-4 TaxID=2775394 RepID=UPI0035CCFA17